jgi:hypothetical protein
MILRLSYELVLACISFLNEKDASENFSIFDYDLLQKILHDVVSQNQLINDSFVPRKAN